MDSPAAKATMLAMRSFHHPGHALHAPQFFLVRGQVKANYEIPARADSLLAGLRALGLTPERAEAATSTQLLSVHTSDYLEFLEKIGPAWAALPNAGNEAVGNAFPTADALASGGRRPAALVGQVGWYTADTACPIGAHTWAASIGAAGCALAAAAEAAAGRQAYALCRPPGHHTYAARAGGHCYINNAALAVESLRAAGARRVAVLDIDSHHGNGTQGIFWNRADVLTVSVHGDPGNYYPWFTGHAEETGGPAGEGRNLNMPLPLGTPDAGWLDAVQHGVAAVRDFGAEALVVSLGFDASEHEPLNALNVTPDGFARAGAMIGRMGLPCAIIQEGGYNVELLGALLQRFLTGWSRQ